MNKRRHILLALVTFLFTACGERAERREGASVLPDTGGTLVIAIPNEPDAVNSLLSGERYGQEINRNVLYLPLVTYDERAEITPMLAESWEMHDDTAVTFRLRRDVYWHDGVRTSAHDVVFTFERGRDALGEAQPAAPAGRALGEHPEGGTSGRRCGGSGSCRRGSGCGGRARDAHQSSVVVQDASSASAESGCSTIRS